MEFLGRRTQLNKLHSQATDHLGWQVRNILEHETFWEVCYTAFLGGFWRSYTAILLSHNPISWTMLPSLHVTKVGAKGCSARHCLATNQKFVSGSSAQCGSTHCLMRNSCTTCLGITLTMLLFRADWKKGCGTSTKVNSKKWAAKVIHCSYCSKSVS